MQLEDYFLFEKVPAGERIRVKGTRIAIEHILEPYLKGESAERIFHGYRHALTLEQVYATITYYLRNKGEVEAYLARSRAADEAAYQEYLRQEPPEVVKRLRALAAEREKSRAGSS
jgi:uncharacterized protein (DUF433 family)